MFKRIFSAALVFGAAAMAPPLYAQPTCFPRDDLVKSLNNVYNEKAMGGGLQSPTKLVEIWASEHTGSFTIFMTRPDGISCILTSGRHWQTFTIPDGKGVAG